MLLKAAERRTVVPSRMTMEQTVHVASKSRALFVAEMTDHVVLSPEPLWPDERAEEWGGFSGPDFTSRES